MSDQTPRQQAAEAAAIRRRWITLGEVLAVVAVLISALTLWNSYQERRTSEVERARSETKAESAARTLLLKGTPSRDGDRLELAALREDQTIQAQTITFPSPLGITPVETTGDARIEASWFRAPLVAARKAARRPAETRGDEKLPVLLTTRFLADGVVRTDRAIYEIGYATETGFLQGTAVRLRGLSLQVRVGSSGEKLLDGLWAGRMRPATK